MITKYNYYSRPDYTVVSRHGELPDCIVSVYTFGSTCLAFPSYQGFTEAERQEAYNEFMSIREDE